MRPARYIPSMVPVTDIIDNLAYVMGSMLEKESACANGIAFVANMDGWTMSNFTTEYCFKFMQMLQGNRVPVTVTLFLIVNPPSWFNKVWSVMKPMLSEDFRAKVRMIPDAELGAYLSAGYEAYLPTEMKNGQANTDALVEDYVDYRLYLEEGIVPDPKSKTKAVGFSPLSKKKNKQKKRKGFFSYWSPKSKLPAGQGEVDAPPEQPKVSAAGVLQQ